MAAASKPARFGLPWERIQEIVRYHKVLRIHARDMRAQSAEVRERSYLLGQENADLKDVLGETMLYVWARHDAIAESTSSSKPKK